jgi:hypothetical protein
LDLTPKTLIQSDFCRVEGLKNKGFSFDKSIHFMNNTALL